MGCKEFQSKRICTERPATEKIVQLLWSYLCRMQNSIPKISEALRQNREHFRESEKCDTCIVAMFMAF